MRERYITMKYNGAVSLLTVIIVSAIILVLTITTLSLSIDFSTNSKAARSRVSAKISAYSCLEEALSRVKDNLSYVGVVTIDQEELSCESTITNPTQGQTEVIVNGFSGEYTYSFTASVDTTVFPIKITEIQ